MKKKMAAIGGLAAGLICLSACNGGGGGQLPHDNQIHPDLDQAFVSELFYLLFLDFFWGGEVLRGGIAARSI